MMTVKDSWHGGKEVELVSGPYNVWAEANACMQGYNLARKSLGFGPDRDLITTIIHQHWTGKRWLRGGHWVVRKVNKKKVLKNKVEIEELDSTTL